MSHPPIPVFIRDDLARVEAIFVERIHSQSAVVRAVGDHMLATGGRRLRAELTLLAARFGSYNAEQAIHAAAAVELIYAALYVHKALIDHTEQRGEYLHSGHWNSDIALMIGDYLLALAASEMALAPDPRIIDYFSRGVMTLSEGELAPVTITAPEGKAREQYLYHIGARTASLFEAACKAGMVCAAGTQAQVDALGRCGYNLGMAYQIANDVFDIADDAAPNANLRSGIITLPLIAALAAGADPRLAAVVHKTEIGEDTQKWAMNEIRRAGGDHIALAEARRYAAQAMAELAAFPESESRTAIEAIITFATEPNS